MNQRILKFRVWRKSCNSFLSPYHLHIKLAIEGHLYSELVADHNDLIFQQFTGLKDSKNKEIYEGDIIKYIYASFDSFFEVNRGEIQFLEGSFVSFDKDEPGDPPGRYDIFFDKYTFRDLEIIGNIFENPELLTNNI